MAVRRAATSLQTVREVLRTPGKAGDPVFHCLAPRLSRSMATEASISSSEPLIGDAASSSLMTPGLTRRAAPVVPKVLTTVYSFPTMEPLHFSTYAANQLSVPLRRDILHRAVIFEGDATRQGTASTKWRNDVHGSGRKIRPQKGMGMARLGDKKSPMLRGGGVAFGPHPRDFSTELPKKIYDLAWRTALSYRYSRGELVVIADGTELEQAEPRWLKQIMDRLHIGAHNGRSTIVTTDHRPNLFTAFDGLSAYGKVKTQDKVDVKNLLETGRIIIEKSALDWIFKAHRSHVKKSVAKAL